MFCTLDTLLAVRLMFYATIIQDTLFCKSVSALASSNIETIFFMLFLAALISAVYPSYFDDRHVFCDFTFHVCLTLDM